MLDHVKTCFFAIEKTTTGLNSERKNKIVQFLLIVFKKQMELVRKQNAVQVLQNLKKENRQWYFERKMEKK